MNRRGHQGKVDAVQAAIVEALRNDGVIVRSLAGVGDGMNDLLCAVPDELFLIELKCPDEKLTPKQKAWHRECPWRNHIAYSAADALTIAAHSRGGGRLPAGWDQCPCRWRCRRFPPSTSPSTANLPRSLRRCPARSRPRPRRRSPESTEPGRNRRPVLDRIRIGPDRLHHLEMAAMSLVRFAMVCDKCKVRQGEYDGYLTCAECGDDVCQSCCAVYDPDPPGHAVCKECSTELVKCANCDRKYHPVELRGDLCQPCRWRCEDDAKAMREEAGRTP